jgi:hypothetical protein
MSFAPPEAHQQFQVGDCSAQLAWGGCDGGRGGEAGWENARTDAGVEKGRFGVGLLGGMDGRRSRPGSREERSAGGRGEGRRYQAPDDVLTNFLLLSPSIHGAPSSISNQCFPSIHTSISHPPRPTVQLARPQSPPRSPPTAHSASAQHQRQGWRQDHVRPDRDQGCWSAVRQPGLQEGRRGP